MIPIAVGPYTYVPANVEETIFYIEKGVKMADWYIKYLSPIMSVSGPRN